MYFVPWTRVHRKRQNPLIYRIFVTQETNTNEFDSPRLHHCKSNRLKALRNCELFNVEEMLKCNNKKSPWSEQGQWREFAGIIKTDNAVVGMYICSEPLTLTGGSVKSRGEKLRQELPCRRQYEKANRITSSA